MGGVIVRLREIPDKAGFSTNTVSLAQLIAAGDPLPEPRVTRIGPELAIRESSGGLPAAPLICRFAPAWCRLPTPGDRHG